jgi:hypothetical protein
MPSISFGMKPETLAPVESVRILADAPLEFAEPLRELARLRVQQDPRRLARARRDDDDPARTWLSRLVALSM